MRQRWKRLAWLTGILAAVAGFGAFAVSRWEAYRFRVAPTDVRPQPFDPAGWATGSATLRHGMARQLVAEGMLVGRTQAELGELLGPPVRVSFTDALGWYLGERAEPTGLMWNYDEYLLVYLDERGQCREATIGGRD